MPRLTDVDLPDAFKYKGPVTITGSTHFISLSHPQTSAPSNASSISPISHPNRHSSFQQTPLRTQTRRLTMITTMLTPHHRTLLVHCEPLSVVTHMKHMSAELTYHEQTPQRLVTNRTERESLRLHALRRAGRALCCRLRSASLPVGRGVLVLSTAVARRALISRSGR